MNVDDDAPTERYVAGPIRWWLLVLGAALTLTLVTWGFAATVASGANRQVEEALLGADLDTVIIDSVDYRTVTLRGPSSDEAAAREATDGIALVSTVRYTIDESLAPAPVPDPDPVATATAEPSAAPTDTETASPEPSSSEAPVVPLPTFEPILFEAFSADLTATAKASLDSVADRIIDTLESHEQMTVHLDGYSDSYGSDEENQVLTQQRVDNVREHLIRAGVPAGILQAEAHGEESPVATNLTEAGRAQNRRVEITITEG